MVVTQNITGSEKLTGLVENHTNCDKNYIFTHTHIFHLILSFLCSLHFKTYSKWLYIVFSLKILHENIFPNQNLYFNSFQVSSFFKIYLCNCIGLLPVCMCAFMTTTCFPGVLGGQKRFWIPLKWSYKWLGAAL